MKEEIPKCYECVLKLQGNPMKEIGCTGRTIQICEPVSVGGKLQMDKIVGIRAEKIYQCELCKAIKIN